MGVLGRDYPRGPSIITRVHVRRRQEGLSQREAGVTMDAEVQVGTEGAPSQGTWAPQEVGKGEEDTTATQGLQGEHGPAHTLPVGRLLSETVRL